MGQGNRQKLADNYLSLKAYSVASVDKVFDYVKSGKGVLQVDKLSGKAGNYVYVNGHSVGLSNKLNDFSKLGCRITVYESTLAKMTSQLTALGKNAKKRISVKPPEWQGKL